MSALVQRLRGRIGLQAVLGLGGAAALLLVLAVIGAIKVSNDNGGSKTAAKTAGGATQVNSGIQPGAPAPSTSSTAAARTAGPAPGAAAAPAATAAPSVGGGAGSTTKRTLPSPPGATRLGVSQTTIKVGIHAPVTLNGAPLSIAADAIEGIKSYITALNQAAGAGGRTIDHQIADDRYTVDGGKQAANQLVTDYKPFIIRGTLGIDQIFQVASAAHGAGIPYMAAGGPDQASDIFKNLGM